MNCPVRRDNRDTADARISGRSECVAGRLRGPASDEDHYSVEQHAEAIAAQARARVGRDVGEAVIAALHPFAPLGTSGGFDRGAGRLDISSRAPRLSRSLVQAPFVDPDRVR